MLGTACRGNSRDFACLDIHCADIVLRAPLSDKCDLRTVAGPGEFAVKIVKNSHRTWSYLFLICPIRINDKDTFIPASR